jgi:hypothetical protein
MAVNFLPHSIEPPLKLYVNSVICLKISGLKQLNVLEVCIII